jgi:hypothetical protein
MQLRKFEQQNAEAREDAEEMATKKTKTLHPELQHKKHWQPQCFFLPNNAVTRMDIAQAAIKTIAIQMRRQCDNSPWN